MKIDDSIVVDFLLGKEIKNSWIFESSGGYNAPDKKNAVIIKTVYERINSYLKSFKVKNEELFVRLFKENYANILNNMEVILSVGCSYGAFFELHENKPYMVIDMGMLASYVKYDYDVVEVVRNILTQEIAHRCVGITTPYEDDFSYYEMLSYSVYDDGITSLLSYAEDSFKVDWNAEDINKKFDEAKKTMTLAMYEKNENEMSHWLDKTSGDDYWGRFSAVLGMIYFGKNLDNIEEIFNNDWHFIIDDIFKGNA